MSAPDTTTRIFLSAVAMSFSNLSILMGKLGRNRVCAVVGAGVKKQPDFGGVVYMPLDANDAHKLLVAREMRLAGLDVDLDLLMSKCIM